MIVLAGTYNGKCVYYPFIIDPKKNGTNTIARNTAHTINITLKRLGGSPDPETPLSNSDADLMINVEPWGNPYGSGNQYQDEEW
jgi:hypothetical protein